MVKKIILALLLAIGLPAMSQTLTFPALSTNNTFTGTNIFTNQTTFTTIFGPSVAPSGACSTGQWEFTQDGYSSFCNASAWVKPFPSAIGNTTYSGNNTFSGNNSFSGNNVFSNTNTFSALLTLATMIGPATAPTGACSTNGIWEISQDGKYSFCNGTAWTQPIPQLSYNNTFAGLNTFSQLLTLLSLTGPATAPAGSCSTNGVWEFTQDGAITTCSGGAWKGLFATVASLNAEISRAEAAEAAAVQLSGGTLSGALGWTGGPTGTPATTTLGNLGGISSVTTSPQTMAGALSGPSMQGVINIASPIYLGSGDLGQALTTAYSVWGQAPYYIPTGAYTTSHTLTLPVNNTGKTSLTCAPGTIISYTGTGDALAVLGATGSNANANIVVSGCNFTLTNPAPTSGIHLLAVNQASFYNDNIIGPGTGKGDGVWNQGANTISFYDVTIGSMNNGFHNVGVVLSGACYAPNAIHMIGGFIAASVTPIYEDGSQSAATGSGCTVNQNQNDTFQNVAIELNGAPITTSTAFSINGSNVVTFTGASANSYVAGNNVLVSKCGTGTYLNGAYLQILTSSAGTITASSPGYTHGTVTSTSDTCQLSTGSSMIENCQGCSFQQNYSEFSASTIYDVWTLGDINSYCVGGANACAPTSPVLFNNLLANDGAVITNDFDCINCIDATVLANDEQLGGGNPTNFFNNGALSTGTTVGVNQTAASNYVTGSGGYIGIDWPASSLYGASRIAFTNAANVQTGMFFGISGSVILKCGNSTYGCLMSDFNGNYMGGFNDTGFGVGTQANIAADPFYVNQAGLIVTSANDATIPANGSAGTTTSTTLASFTTSPIVLPSVPISTTKRGHCDLYFQDSSVAYTGNFGFSMSATGATITGYTTTVYAAAGTQNGFPFSFTGTTGTAISTATTAGVINTTYKATVDFTLTTGATNAEVVTLLGQVSNAGDTLSIEPGSGCGWLP